MLQNPDKSSQQKYVSFTLNSKISKDSNISLKDSKDNEIISLIEPTCEIIDIVKPIINIKSTEIEKSW